MSADANSQRALNRYRKETAESRMPGVTTPTFMCRGCKRNRGVSGRKPVDPGNRKAGYLCAECHVKRKDKQCAQR